MANQKFSIFIKAPKEKVWDVMLSDESYREWTKAFNGTSRFEGDWSEGSKMLFIGLDEKTGEEGGMASRVKENKLHEFISLEHYAILNGGVEEPWAGGTAYENYSFNDEDGGTDLRVELIGIPGEYAPMFEEMWPKALQSLKEICER